MADADFPIDALVFDFDGTILDTEWSDYQSVAEVFGAHGAELPLEEWRAGVGTTDKRHWTEWLEEVLGRPIDRETLRRQRLERHHRLIGEEVILPGIVELLDQADDRGVPTAVASSSPADWVVPHLERIGLSSRFEVVVTADDVVRVKPAPDLFLAAVAAVGARPGRSVAIEDSAHGCAAARSAGLVCVAVPNRMTEPQRFDDADLVVASLAGLGLDRFAALLGCQP